ncbi:MAG: lamin tail domain-containing protein [Chloroflexota bacterium]
MPSKLKALIGFLLTVLLFAGCYHPVDTPTAALTMMPTLAVRVAKTASAMPPTSLPEGAAPVVIGEVLAGIAGNNTYEFIELYNRSEKPVELQGWALWYRLPNSDEDLFVYRWQKPALIAPFGHYLLTYNGEDVGLPADAAYHEQALNLSAGGLQLRQTDGAVVDAVGWGNAPPGFYEGSPAPKLTHGVSLERLPGDEAGNGLDSDDNNADFVLRDAPGPQNSGSAITPLPAERIELLVEAPSSVEPGGCFTYTVTVLNVTGRDLHNLAVTLPIPVELTADTKPLLWQVPDLAAGRSVVAQFPVCVPYAYFDADLRNAFVRAENWPAPAFAAPAITHVAGGRVPIGAARALSGSELTIEGVAVMYTGGYYAGSGNTKFYLADETGSIQVQVFGGQNVVNVRVGDHVRVRGEVSIYRDALQIVPGDPAADVTILARAGDAAPFPADVGIEDAATDVKNLPGRLIGVEGLVTRVEEFAYSYEIDLSSETGVALTVYVDKQTGIDVAAIESGLRYRAIGILDRRDGQNLLYPRFQSDLVEAFPPVLRLDAAGPLTRAGNKITYTITAYNHTAEVFHNVVITATQPHYTSIFYVQGGERRTNRAVWTLPALPANEAVAVTLVLKVTAGYDGPVVLDEVVATADEWQAEPAAAATLRTFSGDTVPVWAIQGDGFRSPLAFERLAAQGVVTGVFPGLEGFFIQDRRDEDPLTSEGIFVSSAGLEVDVMAGDRVRVHGKVRELSGQTSLQLATAADVEILARGQPLPKPVELDPPADLSAARAYYESLEGMFCQVTGPARVVAPTSKYGETVLVLARHEVTRLYQGDEARNGLAIMVDDGSSVTYTDRSQMPYAAASGDTLRSLAGPLAYTYERYKLEPVVVPVIQPAVFQPVTLPPVTSTHMSLMTWNVENLFDTRPPHPSDPPLPTQAQYEVAVAKVANTIEAAGAPLIVALQEVENVGVLQDVADQQVLAAYAYRPVLIEGFDSRGIDVGYLIRSDRVEVLDVQQRDAPGGITSRPPLVIKASVQLAGGPVMLYVINNHFTSMSGGEQASEPRRMAQAEWNLALLEEILAADPQAMVAVVGDLNAYLHAAPVETLRAGGLRHIFDACLADESICTQGVPYTYLYQGEAQVLDHVLVSPGLYALLDSVFVLHVNADYPLPDADDTSPRHKSDHDPVIATFTVPDRR